MQAAEVFGNLELNWDIAPFGEPSMHQRCDRCQLGEFEEGRKNL
jgi:hypothetical protein